MKKFLLIFIILPFTLTFGCSKSDGSILPTHRDLSGLEGEWRYHVIFDGWLDGWDKTDKVYETQDGTIFIYTDSITNIYGDELSWEYDGSTLVFLIRVEESTWDYWCGNVWLSISGEVEVRLAPGATRGTVRGDSGASLHTDFCGSTYGTLRNQGDIRLIH